MFALITLFLSGNVCAAPATQQEESHKGITVEDLARGLRSATQNVEKEIPKIGPAIGNTIKSASGNRSEKSRTQDPPAPKK